MDTAFFILSKLVGLALQIETWLVVGMALSLLGGMFARARLAGWSGGITLAALLLVSMFPIGELLLRSLEAEFPPRASPEQIDVQRDKQSENPASIMMITQGWGLEGRA